MRKRKAILAAAVAAVFATAAAGALVACNENEGENGVYEITFDANGGYFTSIDPVTLSTVAGHLTELPTETPQRANYRFTGWNLQADGTGEAVSLLTVFEDGTTVYAQWDLITAPPTTEHTEFDITFDANGGTLVGGGTTKKLTATDGEITVGLPQVNQRDGWLFGGWNTKADGTGMPVTSHYKYTGTTTVYAKWDPAEEDPPAPVGVFDIKFDANGGTLVNGGTVKTLQTLNGYLTEDLPAVAARDGWLFGGWNTQADGEGNTISKLTNFTEGQTVYAKWDPNVAEHSGTFAIDGGVAQELIYNGNPVGDEATIEFYTTSLTLTGGQAVSFVVDGDPLTFVADSRSHGARKSGNTMVAKAAGGTYDIYVRYYDGNEVWTVEMNDNETEQTNVYYLVGTLSDWTIDSSYKMTAVDLTDNESSYLTKKYSITGVNLAANEELKIKFHTGNGLTDKWYGTLDADNVSESIATIGGEEENADNIVINTPGIYDIYFKFRKSGTTLIYICATGSGDIEEPPAPETVAKVNGTLMTDNTSRIDPENETETYEYQATLSLDTDATVSFTVDDETVEVWIEKNTDVAITGANSRRTSFKTKKGGEFTFTLKYYTDGGADGNGGWVVYVDGPTEDPNTDPEPALVKNAFYLVGGDYGFNFVSGYRQLDSNNSITLYIEEGQEFKIARCGNTETGATYWGTDHVDNFGKGDVTKGIGYLENAANMKFKFDGMYTITLKGSNVEITSSDVTEPIDYPYSAKVTFADNVTVTIIFAMPQNWGLSAAELNSGVITLGTTNIAINSSNGVEETLTINSTSVKVKVAFRQGTKTKWGESTITFENGGTYMLSISQASGSWNGDQFTLISTKS